MKVTITGYSDDGTCGFCRREGKEGVTCSFEDGSYSGFLCLGDLKKFLRLKFPAKMRPETSPAMNGG